LTFFQDNHEKIGQSLLVDYVVPAVAEWVSFNRWNGKALRTVTSQASFVNTTVCNWQAKDDGLEKYVL